MLNTRYLSLLFLIVMQYKYILSVCSTFQLARTLSIHPLKAIMKMKSHGQTFVLQLKPKLQNEVLCIRFSRFFCCHARMLPFKCERRRRGLFLASSHCQQGTARAEQKISRQLLQKLIRDKLMCENFFIFIRFIKKIEHQFNTQAQ